MERGFCPIRVIIESPQGAIDRRNNRLGLLETQRRRIVKMLVDGGTDPSRYCMLRWIEGDIIKDEARESRRAPRRRVNLGMGSKVRIPLCSIPLR